MLNSKEKVEIKGVRLNPQQARPMAEREKKQGTQCKKIFLSRLPHDCNAEDVKLELVSYGPGSVSFKRRANGDIFGAIVSLECFNKEIIGENYQLFVKGKRANVKMAHGNAD